MRSRAGEGRKGELMGFGSRLQLDGVKPSIKPHPGQAASAWLTGVCLHSSEQHVCTRGAAAHSALRMNAWVTSGNLAFIAQPPSCCTGSNLMRLIDAFSLNPAHQKLVKLVCHWNAPVPSPGSRPDFCKSSPSWGC